MSRTAFYLVALFLLILGLGCATTPPGEVREAPTPAAEAVQGPRPEATLQRPVLPPEKAIEAALAVPEAFRFDARKKEALQKRKPTTAVRRVPAGTLMEPAGRQAPLSLSSQELPRPLPPPEAPELTPVIPDDARAGRAGSAAFSPEVGDPDRELRSDGRDGVAPGAAVGGELQAAVRDAGNESGVYEPSQSAGHTANRDQQGTEEPRDESGEEPEEEWGKKPGDERIEESRAARSAPPEDRRETAPPGGESDGGAGESYPYQLVESSERTESVVGEELLLRLPGEGWLYLGEGRRSEDVRFLSQREQQGETIFRFRIGRPGEYELRFQRQELFSGRVAEHTLQVAASDEAGPQEPEEAATRLAEERGETGNGAVAGESAIDRGAGRELSADEMGLPGEPAGVMESSTPEELRWPEDFTTEALLQDPGETLRRVRESETYDAVSLAEMITRRGDPQGAITLLEAYQGAQERELELDEVWFRMAQLLEKEAEARDLRRSVALYERIVDEYPLSVYYEPSRQRAEHLKRHFFLVR